MNSAALQRTLSNAYFHPRPLATNLGNLQGETLEVYVDGGCRPNPGIGGIGIHGAHCGIPVLQTACLLGDKCTNNVAEFMAAYLGLAWAGELVSPGGKVRIYTDSRTIAEQIRGESTPHSSHMAFLRGLTRGLIENLTMLGTQVDIIRIPREMNIYADKLVNEAFEGKERASLLLLYTPHEIRQDTVSKVHSRSHN